ncbi:hypothetical protein [Robertkochia solimangrovi]|uniref:hypothetical protein n=1 Tax=Robertkochia solimangrovi TaxID=2213046 RepID=UPI00117E7055|nr:hypothetical protein [Robertkochia solimangrovi]TRZ45278.1 hypothetical protein DMZ48_05905 [Robertkochia solimangrovi]
MKRILFIMVLLIQGVAIAQQRGGDPQERFNKMIEEQVTTLGLEGETKDQFIAIQEKYHNQMMEQRGSRDFDKMRSMMEARDEEIKGILDENQFAKYQELQEQNRKRMREGMKNRQ